jgi:Uma2 family endonuclease
MAALPLRTWTREEYRLASEAGIIRPEERLELLDGQIVKKVTHNPPHAVAYVLVTKWLVTIVGHDLHVRSQVPIALSAMSEPEPDVAVVSGEPRRYARSHPRPDQVELLVEISDTSLDRDRRVKAPLYAAAGIKELWILDLVSRKLEMHREPAPAGYRVVTILAESESASPLFSPSSFVRIADLLPTTEV